MYNLHLSGACDWQVAAKQHFTLLYSYEYKKSTSTMCSKGFQNMNAEGYIIDYNIYLNLLNSRFHPFEITRFLLDYLFELLKIK